MATNQDYAVGTAAALAAEHKIISGISIPSFLIPTDAVLSQYSAAIAKAVIDAVDAERAKGSTS